MKAISLFTGGKDSTYSLYRAIEEGYEVKTLLSIVPENDQSYLYHSKNIGLTSLMAESIQIDIFKANSVCEKEKEPEELREAIKECSNKYDFDTIIAGAIKSNYQKNRLEKIAKQLSLNLFLPLWEIEIEKYMKKLVDEGFEAMITGTSAGGLDKSFLGKKINYELINELKEVKEEYGINLAGEGGEYETTVLDAPIFNKRIKIQDYDINYDEKNLRGELRIKEAVFS